MESILIHCYDKNVLSGILEHPETARKNVWHLFTTFFWHRLKEEVYQMVNEDEDPELTIGYEEFKIDGFKIDAAIHKTILECSAEDFIEAMNGGMTVRIKDKPIRIPKNENVTKEILATKIFQFQPDNNPNSTEEMLVIDRNQIYEVEDNPINGNQSTEIGEEVKKSREFFKKLVYLVEKTDDGWDKLTDIEAACYVWGLQMAKYDGKYVKEVPDKVLAAVERINRDVGDFTLEELTSCWVREYDSASVGVDTQFSVTKMEHWAEGEGQKSIVNRVNQKIADDYWYLQGVKSFF